MNNKAYFAGSTVQFSRTERRSQPSYFVACEQIARMKNLYKLESRKSIISSTFRRDQYKFGATIPVSGSSNPDRDQGWPMAGCIHANGRGAVEATT